MLHGRVRLHFLLTVGAAGRHSPSTRPLQPLARSGGRVGLARIVVSLEGFPEGALFLGNRLGWGGVRRAPRLAPSSGGVRCGVATGSRPLALRQQFDEIGREEADGAPVSPQAAHPPCAIAGVQALDQVAFDETEVALGLSSP